MLQNGRTRPSLCTVKSLRTVKGASVIKFYVVYTAGRATMDAIIMSGVYDDCAHKERLAILG